MRCHINPLMTETAYSPNAAENGLTDPSPAPWYVAYTEPRQEDRAASNLQQQGFLTYLPLYRTAGKKSTRQAAACGAMAPLAYEPMFARYLFFRPPSDRLSISSARSTRGVCAVVRFGSDYALVQPSTLAAIQEHERQHNLAGLRAGDGLHPGRRVRLSDPVLSGLEGLVRSASAQRIIVLMEVLGRQTRISLARDQVEAI